MLMEKKLDRRVQRTRRMLRDALIEVILEKGYEAVTVQDITERADLRRATFYLHYRDKEELLLTALEETFEELVKQIESVMQSDGLAGKTQLEPYLVTFKHVEANQDLYRSILCGQGAAVIAQRIRDYLANHVHNGLALDAMTVPSDVLANYIAGTELALITWWLEHNRPYSAEHMARMTHRLILNGAQGVLKSPED
jgi:AcrR family transcriptional regulator